MAYASWVTPDKVSGNGNDTVSWTGSVHTGRNSRTTTATFAASGVESKTLTIVQAGKAEFVDIQDTATVAKSGGTLTVTGTSNSPKLYFRIGPSSIGGLSVPATYLANSVQTSNDTAIAGDPGATQEYAFSITFTGIQENEFTTPGTCQLTVEANNGSTDICDITQAAGDAYLTISPATINLTAAGSAVSVSVSSNTSWTIS